MDRENWVEPAQPLTQAERERAFVLDNGVIEAAPRSGCLQPGATQQVGLVVGANSVVPVQSAPWRDRQEGATSSN